LRHFSNQKKRSRWVKKEKKTESDKIEMQFVCYLGTYFCFCFPAPHRQDFVQAEDFSATPLLRCADGWIKVEPPGQSPPLRVAEDKVLAVRGPGGGHSHPRPRLCVRKAGADVRKAVWCGCIRNAGVRKVVWCGAFDYVIRIHVRVHVRIHVRKAVWCGVVRCIVPVDQIKTIF
jgi:hypothetical protein